MNDELQRLLGPWTLSLPPADDEHALVGDFPAFIFDYAGLSDKEGWEYAHSVKLESHWLPLGIFGDDIEITPNDDAEGALLLDTNSAEALDEMAVHVIRFSDNQIAPLAGSVGELALRREPADPDECVRCKNNGNQLFQAKDFAQAMKQYVKAIWANPKNPDPYNNLAMAREAYCAGAGSLELFRTSFLLDPTYTNGMRSYAKSLLDGPGDSDAAIEVLQKAIAVAPSEAHNHACLADIYTRIYALDKAEAPCARALELDPEDRMALAVRKRLALTSPLECIESDLDRTEGQAEFRLLLANLNEYKLSEEDVGELLTTAKDRFNYLWLSIFHGAMLENMTLSTGTAVRLLEQLGEGSSAVEHLSKWPDLPSDVLLKILREELRSLIDDDDNDVLFGEVTGILEAHTTFQRPVDDEHAFVLLGQELASHLKVPNQRFGNKLLVWLEKEDLVTEESEPQHWYEENFATAFDGYKKEILAIVEERKIPEGGIDNTVLSHSQGDYLLGVHTDEEDENTAGVEAFEEEGYEFWMAFSEIAEEEWPEFTDDSDVAGEFPYFLIFVLLGQVSLALREDPELKMYYSAKHRFAVDVDEVTYSPEFNLSVPSEDLRKRILADFTTTPSVQELLLSLWSDDVGKAGQRFIDALSGEKKSLWSRGAAFVRGAMPSKKQEVSEETLRDVVAHAKRLYEDENYTKAIAKLEPVLLAALDTSISAVHLEQACNWLGMMHKKGGALQEAESWFAKGAKLFVSNCALQLCSLHWEGKNGPKLVAAAEPIQCATPYSDSFGYYKRYYLAMGYLLSRQPAKAVKAFSELQSYLSEAPKRIAEVREDIEKFTHGDGELAGLGKELLESFKAPEIPQPRQDDNAEWWAGLSPELQSMFEGMSNLSAPPQASELDALLGSTKLELGYEELSDISFLRAFSCLTVLRLSDNAICDLRPIAELKTLRTLFVDNNPLTDLVPLSELTYLEELDFAGCEISSLEPLKDLQYLTKLKFDENQVVDLSPLQGLKFLEEIDFEDNEVEDLSPLSTCTNLTEIECDDNPVVTGFAKLAKLRWIRDWEFATEAPADQLRAIAAAHPYFLTSQPTFGVPEELEGLYRPKLSEEDVAEFQAWASAQREHSQRESWRQITQYLDDGTDPDKAIYWFHTEEHFSAMDEKNLGDLEPLRPFKVVSWLGIDNTGISDLTPIADWTHLRSLIVYENPITSLEPLCKHRHLHRIRVDDCKLRSLEGIENNSDLKFLNADGNSIESLQPLADMRHLRSLSLQNNAIESLEPLRGLQRLRDIDLTQNAHAIDLAPLQECENLVTLDCSTSAGISNVGALKDLPLLRKVDFGRQADADEVRALQSARPEVRIT